MLVWVSLCVVCSSLLIPVWNWLRVKHSKSKASSSLRSAAPCAFSSHPTRFHGVNWVDISVCEKFSVCVCTLGYPWERGWDRFIVFRFPSRMLHSQSWAWKSSPDMLGQELKINLNRTWIWRWLDRRLMWELNSLSALAFWTRFLRSSTGGR